MAYNLESFELFVVSIPRTRRVVGYALGIGTIAGLLAYGALVLAGTAEATVTLSGLEVPAPLVLVATFAGATVLGGVAISLLVPSYPPSWGQYLALVCEILAGALVPVGLALESSTVLWFALGTAFLFAMQALVVSDGLTRLPLHAVAGAVLPAVLFAGLVVTTPLSASGQAGPVAVLAGVAVALAVVSQFIRWLFGANVTEVGPFDISANLVQRTRLDLGMGVETEVPVQTLAIDADRRSRIVAPWVHPGVLEGVGGGRLTPNLLDRFNPSGNPTPEAVSDGGAAGSTGERASSEDDTVEGTDGRADDERPAGGFFWHVPSTHLSDSADPGVHEPVIDAVGEPETTPEASRLISRTYGETTFHGRRYGDERVVFVSSDSFNDVEVDVFEAVIDPERTLVVDRHASIEEEPHGEVYREHADAQQLREWLREFLSVLEEQPLSAYHAGDAVDHRSDDISLHALVEEVDGQRTVLLTADQNERPHTPAAVKAQLDDEFDEFLLLTTDTHASVYDNRFDPQATDDRIRSVVERATEAVTDAAAGLSASTAEVNLLRKDYHRFIYSLNIIARVYITSLAGLYVLLAVGLVLV